MNTPSTAAGDAPASLPPPADGRRTALLTGTTSGIGAELSAQFAAHGFALVLVARDAARLESQRVSLSLKYGGPVHVVVQDLAETGAAARVHAAVRRLGRPVDVLVNNAGFNAFGRFFETSLERETLMMQLHMVTLTQLTKLLLPDMLRRGWGRILNVGSTGSFVPCPRSAVYAATKAFVYSFSSALGWELAGTGVKVTTLCPGATRTEFARKAALENTLLFRVLVMDARDVARSGFRGCLRGQRVVVPGWFNRLQVGTVPYFPACMTARLTDLLLRTT